MSQISSADETSAVDDISDRPLYDQEAETKQAYARKTQVNWSEFLATDRQIEL